MNTTLPTGRRMRARATWAMIYRLVQAVVILSIPPIMFNQRIPRFISGENFIDSRRSQMPKKTHRGRNISVAELASVVDGVRQSLTIRTDGS